MANSDHQPDRLIGPATLASTLLLGALLLGGLWLRSGLIGAEQWPIRWLDVEGELHRTSASQIRAAAATATAGGFFASDLARVRREIEALPWVARAEVSRHWPDVLYLVVVEHRPVARWNESSLLSDQGEVFDVSGIDGMQGLAWLSGPESRRHEVLESWQQMRRQLATVGLDVDRLRLDDRGAWTLELANGIELMLGRDQVDERLSRFVAVHDELRSDRRRPVRVDMRYTNGLAVRWADANREQTEHHG